MLKFDPYTNGPLNFISGHNDGIRVHKRGACILVIFVAMKYDKTLRLYLVHYRAIMKGNLYYQ